MLQAYYTKAREFPKREVFLVLKYLFSAEILRFCVIRKNQNCYFFLYYTPQKWKEILKEIDLNLLLIVQ